MTEHKLVSFVSDSNDVLIGEFSDLTTTEFPMADQTLADTKIERSDLDQRTFTTAQKTSKEFSEHNEKEAETDLSDVRTKLDEDSTRSDFIEFEWNGKCEVIRLDDALQIVDMNEAEFSDVLISLENSFTKAGKRRVRNKCGRRKTHLSSFTSIPKPEFRKLNITYKRKTWSEEGDDEYIKFIQPTAEQKNNLVEYEMDEEDFMWLDEINKVRLSENHSAVSEDTFEFIMDRFEKNSYFENINYAASVDEDALCSVCLDGDCHNSNAIIFCDRCNLPVHQECYGVPYIPEGEWICRRCMYSPSYPVSCVLCPSEIGAFKQTVDNRWAHVVCALFIPEVRFMNPVFLEPIADIDKIPPDRWKLDCYVCHIRGAGACIQCEKPNCFTAFHVTCAQKAGLYMKSELDDSRSSDQEPSEQGEIFVKRIAYCEYHTPVNSLSPNTLNNKSVNISHALRSARQARMLKYRRNLSETERGVPSISLPVISAEEFHFIRNNIVLDDKENFFSRIHNFWRLRRYHRNGVPLIRRLQYEVKLFTKKIEKSLSKKQDAFDNAQLSMNDSSRLEITKSECVLKTSYDHFNIARDKEDDAKKLTFDTVVNDVQKASKVVSEKESEWEQTRGNDVIDREMATDEKNTTDVDTDSAANYRILRLQVYCAYLRFIRQGMERVRLLAELIRKREKIKRLLTEIELAIKKRKRSILKMILERAVEEMILVDNDEVFLNPVDRNTLYYYAVIARPICLKDIKQNISDMLYSSVDDFALDAFTICKNCFTYNISNSAIYKYGKKFQRELTRIIRKARKQYCTKIAYNTAGMSRTRLPNSSSPMNSELSTSSTTPETLLMKSRAVSNSLFNVSLVRDSEKDTFGVKKVRRKRRRKWKREFVFKRNKRRPRTCEESALKRRKVEVLQNNVQNVKLPISQFSTSSESHDSPSDEHATGLMLRSHFR